MGGRRRVRGHGRPRAAEVLLPGDAAVPVGRHPRRPRPQLLHHRRGGALQAHARLQRPAPDRLGRAGPARGERRHQEGRPSREMDPRQHRLHEAPAPAAGLQLPLEPRDRHLRPRVLPVEPVVLPEDARQGHRLSQQGQRQLVPVVPDRARQRAGGGRRVLALPQRGRGARAGPVVPAHHRLPGPAPRRHGAAHGLAGARPRPAAQLDRPLPGGGGGLRGRGLAEPAARVHHAHRHHLRRDLHGPGPRASAAGRAAPRRARRGSDPRRHRPPAGAGQARAAGGPGREGRRLHRPLRGQPVQRGADPDLGRQLRADGVRHRRDHGRARPRPARLRVRAEVRAAGARRDPARGPRSSGDACPLPTTARARR